MDTLTITLNLNDVDSIREQFADVMSRLQTKKEDINKTVIQFAKGKSPSHRKAWTKAVNDGLVDNVHRILCDCYDSLIDRRLSSDTVSRNALALGPIGSMAWREFVLLKIIKSLYDTGSFELEDGSFDTFEDTAGGCDEIVWYKACELLE